MRRALLLLSILVLLAACAKENKVQPVSEYESADIQAKSYDFHVFAGARFLGGQTDLMRRTYMMMKPNAKEPAPMAAYDTDAPLGQVAAWYLERYGYGTIAPNDAPDATGVKPSAYYNAGDFAKDAPINKQRLEKLGMPSDVSQATGTYRGAYFAPKTNLPRVSLQRPYFDAVERKIVDRTLIVMVKE